MAFLWFGKAIKNIDDFKTRDLRKTRVLEEVKWDQLLGRVSRTQELYDGYKRAAAEPGMSEGEVERAAYQMSRQAKAKRNAEAGLQEVQTRILIIDSLIDVVELKQELKRSGIWKSLIDMEPERLEEQVQLLAVRRKEGNLNLKAVSEALVVDHNELDVRARRDEDFRRAREEIEAERAGTAS